MIIIKKAGNRSGSGLEIAEKQDAARLERTVWDGCVFLYLKRMVDMRRSVCGMIIMMLCSILLISCCVCGEINREILYPYDAIPLYQVDYIHCYAHDYYAPYTLSTAEARQVLTWLNNACNTDYNGVFDSQLEPQIKIQLKDGACYYLSFTASSLHVNGQLYEGNHLRGRFSDIRTWVKDRTVSIYRKVHDGDWPVLEERQRPAVYPSPNFLN